MNPKVSILLPNLNNRPFLEERTRSISDQSFRDWEVIVVDGYSDDGAWEFLQAWGGKDGRIRLFQAPRKGIYTAWNAAIEMARGEYLYIATSDDTMRPDCLEKMVTGLDCHPQCGLCHCCLTIIDEQGRPQAGKWESFSVQRYFGELNQTRHIRKAPHDGVLQLALMIAHTSITQLLIRRSLMERMGPFRTDLGSEADFEWNMRVSFAADVLHLPEFLATWRVREGQATGNTSTVDNRKKLLEMCQLAVESIRQYDQARYEKVIQDFRALAFVYQRDVIQFGLRDTRALSADERRVWFHTMLRNPVTAGWAVVRRLLRKRNPFDRVEFMQEYMRQAWQDDLIVPLGELASDGRGRDGAGDVAAAGRAE